MACISTLAGHARHPACGRRHKIPGDSSNKETFAAAPVISWNPSFGQTLCAVLFKSSAAAPGHVKNVIGREKHPEKQYIRQGSQPDHTNH